MSFHIIIEAPDTPGNWTAFNRECEDLNSDFLMQPINEADYDSETQACVDLREEGGPKSFYDHYVTKRRKKKGMRGLGVEHPARPLDGSHPQRRVTPTDEVGFGAPLGQPQLAVGVATSGEHVGGAGMRENEVCDHSTLLNDDESTDSETKAGDACVSSGGGPSEKCVPVMNGPSSNIASARAARRRRLEEERRASVNNYALNEVPCPKKAASSNEALTSGRSLTSATHTNTKQEGMSKAITTSEKSPSLLGAGDFLDVPNRVVASKGALNNAAIRRIACGRNPTPVYNAPTGFRTAVNVEGATLLSSAQEEQKGAIENVERLTVDITFAPSSLVGTSQVADASVPEEPTH